jgi:cell division protein FtsI/penicillin-binding protein 2
VKKNHRSFLFVLILILGIFNPTHPISSKSHKMLFLSKKDLADQIVLKKQSDLFPHLSITTVKEKKQLTPQLTLHEPLQRFVEKLFQRYTPHSAALVAVDATTGRILCLFGMDKKKGISSEIALTAGFPSASLFKIVTAAAAIEKLSVEPETLLPMRGRLHTLYKNQIHFQRPQLHLSFKDAFGKSVNSIFGRLGQQLGQETLQEYAYKLGFNRPFFADIPVSLSEAKISSHPWELVESASGFTQNNKISALHGALIASMIINNGYFMQPYLIDALLEGGVPAYLGHSRVSHQSLDPKTTQALQTLMKETLLSGTSKRSFRRFFSPEEKDVIAGGKTGTLTSTDFNLRTDWFIGYYGDQEKKIGLAVLLANADWSRMKSAKIARFVFDYCKKGL